MKLRILCTLAILAGLAAAPGAEQFRWEAGHGSERRTSTGISPTTSIAWSSA